MLWDSRNEREREGGYYLDYVPVYGSDYGNYHKIARTGPKISPVKVNQDHSQDSIFDHLDTAQRGVDGAIKHISGGLVNAGANLLQALSRHSSDIGNPPPASSTAVVGERRPSSNVHKADAAPTSSRNQSAGDEDLPRPISLPAAPVAAAQVAGLAQHPPEAKAAGPQAAAMSAAASAAALAPSPAPPVVHSPQPQHPLNKAGAAALKRAGHITTAPNRRAPNKSSEGRDRHSSATRSSSTSYESHTSRNSSGSKSESRYSGSSDEDGSDEQEKEYKTRNLQHWVRGIRRAEPAHPKRSEVRYYPPQEQPREYDRPQQNMPPRDLFPETLINADTDRSITQDQELINLANGTPQERLEKVVKVIKNTILSIPFDVQNDLFQWTQYLPFCDCCYERPDPQHENGCMKQYGGCCTSLLLLILFYCFGLSLFLVQAQGISNCESGLVNPNAHLNVSCRGLAYECQVMPGVFSFRDYITFRILAYISLLTPFLYMPFTVILYVNMQASKISDMLEAILEPDLGALQQDAQRKAERDGKLKDLTFRDPSVSRLSIMREYIYDELKIMNKEGHNAWVFRLFVVFHVLFGMLSITLDGYFAKMTQNGMDTACSNLQNGILSTTDPNLTHFGFLGIYQLIFGCFYFIVTLLYLIIQQFDVCLTVVKQRRRMDAENAQETIGGKQRQKLLESTVRQKLRNVEAKVSQIVHGNSNSYNGPDQWSGDQPPEWGQGGGWGQGGNPGWDQGGNQGWDQGWGRR